jgi:hypothetical protein
MQRKGLLRAASSFSSIFTISLCLVFCGCGGSSSGGSSVSPATLTGNFGLIATSTVVTGLTTEIGASLVSSGSTVSGSVHISESPCYSFSLDIPMSGTVNSAGVFTLVSTVVNGQTLTVSGTISASSSISGTYAISGGCGAGDRGALSGNSYSPLTGTYVGTITTFSGAAVTLTAILNQASSADAAGYYPTSGTATFSGSCSSNTAIPNAQADSILIGNQFSALFETSTSQIVQISGSFDTLAQTITLSGVSGTVGNCTFSNATGVLKLQ